MEVLNKLFSFKRAQEREIEPPAVAASPKDASIAHAAPNKQNVFPDLSFIKDDSEQAGSNRAHFVEQTAFLFEVTRHKHSRLIFIASSVFLGLVVFTRMYMPLFCPTEELNFGALTPPQLAGQWVLNDVCDVPAPAHNLRFTATQNNANLVANGTDEFGEFDLTGKLIPPNKIHLVKTHHNSQLHDTQVMDGDLTLDNMPLYAHGTWTRAKAIDPTKESLQAEGSWEANFYETGPQPEFTKLNSVHPFNLK